MGAFFPGRLAVGFAYPVIQGTVSLLKYMDSPFTSDFEDIYLPAAEEIRSGAQRYNRMEFNNIEAERGTLEALLKVTSDFPDFEAALTIDDDDEEEEKEENGEDKAKKVVAAAKKYLKTPEAELCLQKLCGYFKVPLHTKTEKKGDTITEITKKIKSLFTIQNIFVVEEAIPAGTRLHSRLSLLPGYGDDELIEITFDAFVETAISKGFIGGMVNRGYGAVITEAKTGTADKPINFSEVSKADKFWGWLEDNREQIRENLLTLDKYLFKKGE